MFMNLLLLQQKLFLFFLWIFLYFFNQTQCKKNVYLMGGRLWFFTNHNIILYFLTPLDYMYLVSLYNLFSFLSDSSAYFMTSIAILKSPSFHRTMLERKDMEPSWMEDLTNLEEKIWLSYLDAGLAYLGTNPAWLSSPDAYVQTQATWI
jgi:hypothetical protein